VQFQDSEMVIAGLEGTEMGVKAFEESLIMPWMQVRQGALIVLTLTQFLHVIGLIHK